MYRLESLGANDGQKESKREISHGDYILSDSNVYFMTD